MLMILCFWSFVLALIVPEKNGVQALEMLIFMQSLEMEIPIFLQPIFRVFFAVISRTKQQIAKTFYTVNVHYQVYQHAEDSLKWDFPFNVSENVEKSGWRYIASILTMYKN